MSFAQLGTPRHTRPSAQRNCLALSIVAASRYFRAPVCRVIIAVVNEPRAADCLRTVPFSVVLHLTEMPASSPIPARPSQRPAASANRPYRFGLLPDGRRGAADQTCRAQAVASRSVTPRAAAQRVRSGLRSQLAGRAPALRTVLRADAMPVPLWLRIRSRHSRCRRKRRRASGWMRREGGEHG